MRRTLHKATVLLFAICMIVMTACAVSYKFNGASIDYNKTKTIQIADFPNRASYVWGPMAPTFNNALKDEFANHTKLQQVKRNGDLKIEGEITQYTNNADHNQDFERQFTATQSYETTQSLASVQEELVNQMIDDIVEQIFNATVANW